MMPAAEHLSETLRDRLGDCARAEMLDTAEMTVAHGVGTNDCAGDPNDARWSKPVRRTAIEQESELLSKKISVRNCHREIVSGKS